MVGGENFNALTGVPSQWCQWWKLRWYFSWVNERKYTDEVNCLYLSSVIYFSQVAVCVGYFVITVTTFFSLIIKSTQKWVTIPLERTSGRFLCWAEMHALILLSWACCWSRGGQGLSPFAFSLLFPSSKVSLCCDPALHPEQALGMISLLRNDWLLSGQPHFSIYILTKGNSKNKRMYFWVRISEACSKKPDALEHNFGTGNPTPPAMVLPL